MDIALQLLELAKKSGAEAAEVYQSTATAHPVFFETNRLKQLETSQSEGLGLRVWRDGRPGLAVAYGLVEPELLVAQSLALCELNEPETPELTPGSTKIYPNLGRGMAVENLIEMGKQAIEIVRSSFPDVSCSSQWDSEVETVRLVNSLGLDYQYADTTLSGFIDAEWVRGEDFLSVGDGQTQRDSLDPERMAQNTIQQLIWAKNNATAPTGKLPVLFTAGGADVLWDTVVSAINGKRVVDRSSPWSNRRGERVISPLISLSQQPDVGPYSCPFDDEGLPTQDLNLIQSGQLQQFYTDRLNGRLLGTGSTGNGIRPGLGSYPSPGLVNLVIGAGDRDFDRLVQTLDRGIIIDRILGGGDGMSGDISFEIDLGYLVEGGEIIGRVKDTMVSGNIYTALDRVIALGNDNDWNGPCYTPSIIVDGLSIVGR